MRFGPITTEVMSLADTPAGEYYLAEDYHLLMAFSINFMAFPSVVHRILFLFRKIKQISKMRNRMFDKNPSRECSETGSFFI